MISGRFTAASQKSATSDQAIASHPALMVKSVSGSPIWVVVLQGGPNPTDMTTMLTHDSSTNVSGETVFSGANLFPTHYRQIVVVSCTGGEIEACAWAH